jgi:hypothetical protein
MKGYIFGWRKVLMMTLGLSAFTTIVLVLELKEAGPIIAVGSQVAVITGAGLWANVAKAKVEDTKQ